MYFGTAKEMETLDKLAVKSGLEIRQMMELAGYHIIELFHTIGIDPDAQIAIVVGSGNKGGDGLSAARHLANDGFKVEIVLVTKNRTEDSQHHLDLLRGMKVPIHNFADSSEIIKDADVIIDSLIGYHLDGAPREDFAKAIKLIHDSKGRVICYDLPSGIDPDSGTCFKPCVIAEVTLTLALPKKLFETNSGRAASGRIFLADIGIPDTLYDKIEPGSRPPFEGKLIEI